MSISRIYRLLRLITLLQSRKPLTPQELAEELQVSRRTVFRDLNMLEMAHIPYYFDNEAGGYRISRHFFLPPVNLNLPEALSLLVLAGRSRTSTQLPLMQHGSKAALKLESILPPHIRRYVGSVLDKLAVRLTPQAEHDQAEPHFDDFVEAIAKRHVCQAVYDSFYEGKQISTKLRPLRLVFLSRAWYVIAYSSLHRENRTFKLARFRSVSLTRDIFEEQHDFRLDEYLGDAWHMIPEGTLHDVGLRFSPKVAGNVAEVRWHRTQRVRHLADGGIEFSVTVDGLREITWWILGYGCEVEVLHPPELRQAIADCARAVLAKYEKDPA